MLPGNGLCIAGHAIGQHDGRNALRLEDLRCGIEAGACAGDDPVVGMPETGLAGSGGVVTCAMTFEMGEDVRGRHDVEA